MASRVGLVLYLVVILIMVHYNIASRARRIEQRLDSLEDRVEEAVTKLERKIDEGIGDLKADLKTVLDGIVFNQNQLKERAKEHTELKHQLLQIRDQRNQSLEIAKLKDDLLQLNEQYNSKTEASTQKMDTSTLKTEASTLTMKASTLKNKRFESCMDLYKNGHRVSGQYDVYPDIDSAPIRVFCDQDTDGGGWTVFQRRKDGSENFNREWQDYRLGFGDLDGEFWLGNNYLSILTSPCCSQLRIDMQNSVGENKYAMYNKFQIRSARKNYSLKVGGYSGNAGDALTYHNGFQFSTTDVDNDRWAHNSCATRYKSAWWYNNCASSDLNKNLHRGHKFTLYWHGFIEHPLIFSEMKFRRLD